MIVRRDVLSIDDLREGMALKGTVRNVVDFGVFVDIGVKQEGWCMSARWRNNTCAIRMSSSALAI